MKLITSPVAHKVLLCAALSGVAAGATGQTSADDPITVDQNWQLFLDDYVVGRATGFDRVLHHPRAMGIVIPADKPWETSQVAPNFFARRQDGTFIAFYTVTYWTPDPESKTQPDR